MSEHPSWEALLRARWQRDPLVDHHVGSCDECAHDLAILEEERRRILEPVLPVMSGDDARAMVERALGVAPASGRPAQGWGLAGHAARWAVAAGALLTAAAAFAVGTVFLPATPPVERPAIDAPPAPVPELPVGRALRPARAEGTAEPPAPPAPRPAPEPEPEPEPMRIAQDFHPAVSLFHDASAAHSDGRPDEARVLLEMLIMLHGDVDLGALAAFDEGLALRLSDPRASAAAFRTAIAADPDGPLAPDARNWLCEMAPADPVCRQ